MNSGAINPFNIPQYISICVNLQTAYVNLSQAVSQIKVRLPQKSYTIGGNGLITAHIGLTQKAIVLKATPKTS